MGNRLGWYTGSATNGRSRNGAETTVTGPGASILGVAAGTHDFWSDDPNFNGLGTSINVGTGDILATINSNILALSGLTLRRRRSKRPKTLI